MTRGDVKLRGSSQYSKNLRRRSQTVSVVLTDLILINGSLEGIL